MTFQEIAVKYNEEAENDRNIDYNYFSDLILDAARQQFPQLTDKQIGIISGENWERNHSHFYDMIWGMHNLCQFAVDILNAK